MWLNLVDIAMNFYYLPYLIKIFYLFQFFLIIFHYAIILYYGFLLFLFFYHFMLFFILFYPHYVTRAAMTYICVGLSGVSSAVSIHGTAHALDADGDTSITWCGFPDPACSGWPVMSDGGVSRDEWLTWLYLLGLARWPHSAGSDSRWIWCITPNNKKLSQFLTTRFGINI